VRTSKLFLLGAVGLCGCSSLFGFHDPHERTDAATDAAADATKLIDAPPDAFMTSYTASAVRFDGTDYLSVGGVALQSALTGAPRTSRQGAFSMWIRFEGGDGNSQDITAAQMQIVSGTAIRGGITRVPNGQIQFTFNQCTGPITLQMQTKSTFTSTSGWHHVAAAWDLDRPTVQLYVDGINEIDATNAPSTIDNNNTHYICYDADDWYVGGSSTGATLNADIADMYAMFGTFIDLGSALQNFRSPATHKPINLGPNCKNVYNGNIPIACFTGNDGGSWIMNKGTGGGMKYNGNGTNLAAATTSPSN
jgi:hypothetical protein